MDGRFSNKRSPRFFLLPRFSSLVGSLLLLARLAAAQPAPADAASPAALEAFRRNCLQAMTKLNHVQMSYEDIRTNSVLGSTKTLKSTLEIQYPYFKGTSTTSDAADQVVRRTDYSFDGSRYYALFDQRLRLSSNLQDGIFSEWISNPLSISWEPLLESPTYLPLVSGELSILPIPTFSSLQLSSDGKAVQLRYADIAVTFQGGVTGYPTWYRTGNYESTQFDILAWTTSPDGTKIPKVIQTVETIKGGAVIKDVITLDSLTPLPASPASHFAISFDAATSVYDEESRATLKSSKHPAPVHH